MYITGYVSYRKTEPSIIVLTDFNYTRPGRDAFFWVGKRRVNGGCNDDNIASDSYSLAPGEIGSK